VSWFEIRMADTGQHADMVPNVDQAPMLSIKPVALFTAGGFSREA
jgi:hypothetical protein